MLLENRLHNEKAEARALDLGARPAGAVEAFENPCQIGRWNTHALIAHSHQHLAAARQQFSDDLDVAGGILDRVIEQIVDGGSQLLCIAQNAAVLGAYENLLHQRIRGEMVPHPCRNNAFVQQRHHIQLRPVALTALLHRLRGTQHLLHGGHETIRILVHYAIKILALRFLDSTGLKRLQIQPNGRNRRLQLVSDRVDEAIVLFVAADLAH